MFFTREDILKIQQALLQLSVKDSELPSAEPITYDDTLSIVQDGKNKQIKIEDFFNQISLWKREDFINITDKYDEHYISLIEAINLVPILQRKDGLVITFQDVEGNWEIYQFRGNITEFFEKDKWFDLYDYRNYIVQSIVPDEEDLTASTPDENRNSLVSLKDRVYDPTSFSGKGYKILRKNIQSVNIASTKITITEAPSSDGTLSFTINGKETQVAISATIDNTTVLVAQKVASALQESMTEYDVSIDTSLITLTRKSSGLVTPSVFSASTTGVVGTITDSTKREFRNILTQDMINKANTIYVIRYDFTLCDDINVPVNCVLKFDGGSIKNRTIKFNNTLLEGNINLSLDIKGTIVNKNIYRSWFNVTDITTILQYCAFNRKLFILDKDGEVSDTIVVKDNFKIEGNGISTLIITFSNSKNLFIGEDINKLEFYNFIINYNRDVIGYDVHCYAFMFSNSRNLLISKIYIKNKYISGIELEKAIYLNTCSYCTITKCKSEHISFIGIYNGEHNEVSYNDIYYTYDSAIEINTCPNSLILGNNINKTHAPSGYSVLSSNSINTIISNNIINIELNKELDWTYLSYGINVGHSEDNLKADNCLIENNTITAPIGILIQNSILTNINNNTVKSNCAILKDNDKVDGFVYITNNNILCENNNHYSSTLNGINIKCNILNIKNNYIKSYNVNKPIHSNTKKILLIQNNIIDWTIDNTDDYKYPRLTLIGKLIQLYGNIFTTALSSSYTHQYTCSNLIIENNNFSQSFLSYLINDNSIPLQSVKIKNNLYKSTLLLQSAGGDTTLSPNFNIKNVECSNNTDNDDNAEIRINGISIYSNHIYSSNKRPTIGLHIGYNCFDKTISKPIYWTGNKWIDATGADV